MGVKSLFLTNHLLTKELRPARQNNDGQALHSATKTADKKHGGPKQIRMTKIQNSKHVKIL
jgi:hypothetical protein